MLSVSTCLLVCALGLVANIALADQQTGQWGDQGDGTFRNPIIAADYSDPDVIRVGADFFMVASTFESAPGVTVLHSQDLVNWKSLGAVISDVVQLGPEFNWDRMNRHGKGVFAPSIRFHAGKFWVFVNCHSGEGFFCCTATNAVGPWTVTPIKDRHGKPLRIGGWTDPCPFWDDDGKAYLAASHPGREFWYGYLFQMTPDGTHLLDADADKMKAGGVQHAWPDGGTLFSPFHSTEGHKIYKRNGYYYLLHIEFLDRGQGKGTYVMRAKHIYGTKADGSPGKPGEVGRYEVLKFAADTGHGQTLPGQGGLVDTADGRWFWLAQFNRYPSDGRSPHLVPVTWVDDWPVIGVNITNRQGQFAWQLPKPIAGQPIQFPQGGDEFSRATLHPQWLWSHQPRAEKWSLTERPGWLRLRAFKPVQAGKFFKVGNVICQRHLRSESREVTIKLDLVGMADGQEAGLANFNGGKNYATLGLAQTNGVRRFKYEEDGEALAGEVLPPNATVVWLRSTAGFDDVNTYAFSLDGKSFTPFGGKYQLKCAGYRGDLIGIYTFNNEAESGFVDADFFRYTFKNR